MTDAAHDYSDIERHPLNLGFTWSRHEGPFRQATDDQVRQFDESGFFVIEHAFEPEELAPVIAELDRFEADVDGFLAQMEDERLSIAERGAITFAPNLVARSDVLAAFSKHEVFVSLCHDLIGPDANLYWDQAVYKKPEKPRHFPWHQDNGYTFVVPQQYVTCWVALTDATVENGCPHVAPGLHHLGTLRHEYVEPLGWQIFEDPPSSVAAPVAAGGIVVFSSLTPHLTGPNMTDAVRKAYILQYAPAGAIRLDGGRDGDPVEVPADDPDLQYPVLRDGVAVT